MLHCNITYTLPYLKWTALGWFEPLLTSGIDAPWLSDYSKFVSELCSHFGPFDPEGEAKVELENLRMHDNQRITKYLVKFNRLMKSPGLGNLTIFRTYEPCHRPLMPDTGNANPKALEKLLQTKTQLTRRSQMTRVKP